jgi:hypothetical protein
MALLSPSSSILRNVGDVPSASATDTRWNGHDHTRASDRCVRASGHTATGCGAGLRP